MKPLNETMTNIPETATTAVVGVTITTTVLTNIGLINAVLGGVSIFVGIIACLFLIRIHALKGSYWKEKLERLKEGKDEDEGDGD